MLEEHYPHMLLMLSVGPTDRLFFGRLHFTHGT